MEDPKWFEAEDPLDPAQQAFVDVLRARAGNWPLEPCDAYLMVDAIPGTLLVCADIVDTTQHVNLMTVGAYLDGDHVRGDKLHNQLLTLPAQPSPVALYATGTPAELGARTADWFENLLRRPVVRDEWLRSGVVYARRWSFADTGQPLVEGRVRTSGLRRQPDRTVHVREDRR